MRTNTEGASGSVGFVMKAFVDIVVTVMANVDLGIALDADNFVGVALFGLFLNRNAAD